MKITLSLPLFAALVFYSATSWAADSREVVVYTALDQIFSEPILQEFEKKNDIKVKAVYDVEAVKTTGLVNRLLAERSNPRCDVFWNNEIMRTIHLKREGVLAPYASPSAADIPAQFKDGENYWAGFGARARVLVVNTKLVKKSDYPASLQELVVAKWQGKAAMANPLFGTTSTHMAALFAAYGPEQAKAFMQGTLDNKVAIVDGNSVVRDMVARGEALIGITDTDDVNVGIVEGMPIAMIPPDQAGDGTLVIPNTVSLVKDAPHQVEAKLLIDFILSREVEEKLARSSSAQIPLRPGIPVPEGQLTYDDLRTQTVDYEKMADEMESSIDAVKKLFLK